MPCSVSSAGFVSGLVVLAFELAIRELAGFGALPAAKDFESLPRWLAFALPAAGATLLGLAFWALRPEDREIGIVHVLSRMHSHYGALPWRNAVVQFIGGAFALATGQSGGREGPGVHLGGAANSLIGQRLGLPNNSLRVLMPAAPPVASPPPSTPRWPALYLRWKSSSSSTPWPALSR